MWVLDAAIARKVAPKGWIEKRDGYWLSPLAIEMDDEDKGHWTAPSYTGSLDAAVSLVGHLLPDTQWMVMQRGYDNGVYQDGKAGAFIQQKWMSHFDIKAFAATPAMALCLAVLKAMAQAEARSKQAASEGDNRG